MNRQRTVLILGGTSDIGIAIAKEFAGNDFTIHLAGRNMDYLHRIAKDVAIRNNSEVKPVFFEATDFDSHRGFYNALAPRPDVCICIFGYLGNQSMAETDWTEAGKIIDINYKGAVSILNIAAEDFAARGEGSVIGISSVAGDRGRQSNYFYGSAKAGFTSYLSGLRNRLYRKGVQVLTVKPGFVATKMTEGLDLPAKLTAKPEQVARAVYQAYRKKKDVIYVLGTWKYIMLLIRNIPEAIFKRLNL